MKNEFILAFNEICEARGLPKEDVFEALKTALVSAYRRDTNISNTQRVEVEIDPRTGQPTIYAEKEVVDDVLDGRTEVALSEAQQANGDNVELGDVIMVDSTTAHFGRIAAQTAKQVLLQRVREAEREHLFEDFSGREDELVNGTVQSISGQHITIGLGRTEAILPKSQQVRGERYRAHDKIRVYVLEVRRTNRGPQIFVSRNHRNLLRRLLELEVPEIYNGQVEIKSIAREAGQRSKVAVQALQPGVDPVGACVGMRGVRIQSIVRELNDEKIDVIEWDPDQRTFIAKALSPARVSQVFLEDHPDEGKTAVVVVPDDQLSLAIGREGQNARLAAKLTGWRIDIKSLTETATESMELLDHPAADPSVAQNEELVEQVQLVLAKKEMGRPITSEDYRTLDRFARGVVGRVIAAQAAEHEETRKQRAQARQRVPDIAWKLSLDELDLPGRVHNLLLDNGIETVGNVLFNLELDEEFFLDISGFGDVSLETLKEQVEAYELPVVEEEEPAVAEEEAEAEEVAAPEETAGEEAEAVEAEEVEEAEVPEPVAEVPEEAVTAAEAEAVKEDEEEVEAEPETAEVEEEEVEAEPEPEVPAIDDLSQSLVEDELREDEEEEEEEAPAIVFARPLPFEEEEEEEEDEEEEESKRKRRRKGQRLVYDEDMGEVVVKRKRKGSRRRPEWEDYDLDDFET